MKGFPGHRRAIVRHVGALLGVLLGLPPLLLAVTGAADESGGFELVTIEEQARALDRPDPRVLIVAKGERGAPSIVVRSPPDLDSVVDSPLDIEIGFEAGGEADVDMTTLRIYYDSLMRLDVTERILAHAERGANFVRALGAELPPGWHSFVIEIEDSLGRVASRAFEVQVSG